MEPMFMMHKSQAQRLGFILLLVGGCRSELNDTTAPDAFDRDASTLDGSLTMCVEADHSYQPGQTFTSADGCNTCQCLMSGEIVCTARACFVDASTTPQPDSSFIKIDSPLVFKDALVVVDSASLKDLQVDTPRDTSTTPDLSSPSDTPLPKDTAIVCVSNGKTIAVGESIFDGCNTCTCTETGQLVCTKKYCPPVDAGTEKCTLPTSLVFGPTGGNALYEDASTLSPPWSYSHTRIARRIEPAAVKCAPPLPACGTAGADYVLAIVKDLADPDVISAFALSTTPIYGRDQRPVDGTVYSIERGDGKTILVGSPCVSTSLSSCRPIPAGVERLVTDLKLLDKKMLQSTECAAFVL
jgi:hypothetical protein